MGSYPICVKCLKSKVLCPDCQQRYDQGIICCEDVCASRTLFSCDQQSPGFIHAVPTRDYVLVIAQEDSVGDVIGESGRNLKSLACSLNCDVKVVGCEDFKKLVIALLAPARVKGFNRVLTGEGELTRIRIASSEAKLLRMSFDDLQKVISAATDEAVELVLD